MQGERKRLSSEEKRQLIFNALFDASGPLTAYELHRETNLGMDSLHYHLRRMVDDGILIPLDEQETTKYGVQSIYYDEAAMKSLETSLELVVSIFASHAVWDFVGNGRDEFDVVSTNLGYFLRSLGKSIMNREG